jgi:putative ABC transport system permease protein
MEALSALPGVTAVSMSSGLPGVDPTWPREFDIEGERTADGTLRFASWRIVTAGYFQTLGIPILEGETCRMDTALPGRFEILVNRSFADRYFPGRDPLGRMLTGGPQGDGASRIAGIVANAREDGQGTEPRPTIYACGYLRFWPDSAFLVQSRDPGAMANAVREVVRAVEPSRPVYALTPMPEALRGALSQTRFRTLLLSLFSLMALALSGIGLYGVTAYMVSQRAREIGIRLALGARPGQILGEILRSGGRLAVAGVAAGIALTAAAARTLSALLYGIQPSGFTAYVSATAVLFAVALVACLIPGRRAVSIDPMVALREQ